MKNTTYVILGTAFVAILAIAIFTSNKMPNTDQKASVSDAIPKIVNLDAESFKQRIVENNPVIIDVRTEDEYREGHIDDALNLNFYADDFTDQIEKLDKEKSYSIYCRSGNRSGQTLLLMKKLGFKDVANLSGGFNSWEQNICLAKGC